MSSDQASDNKTIWTGIITPVDNASMPTNAQGQARSYSNYFNLPYSSYNDIKGNPGLRAFSSNFVVDTKPPIVDHVILTDGLDSTIQDTFTKNDGTYRCIPVDSTIKVVFDYIMDTSGSITTNASSKVLSLIHISEPTRRYAISYAVF